MQKDDVKDDFLPLLPAQQAVADRIEADAERGVDQLPRRNGQIVEPLHHNAHPRSHTRDFCVLDDLSNKPEDKPCPTPEKK